MKPTRGRVSASGIGVGAALAVLALSACAVPERAPRAPVAEALPPAPAATPQRPVEASAPINGYGERFDIIRSEGSIDPLPADQAGAFLDIQEQRYRALAGGNSGLLVEREPGAIRLTLSGAASFESGDALISPEMRTLLDGIADVLGTYQQSYVDVLGHTDSSGPDEVNLRVSQRRAASVATYLAATGVKRVRIATLGRGEAQPIASNDTAQGMERNRRVEIRIIPIVAAATS